MKKLFFLFIIFIFFKLNVLAQEGWFWQNPQPQGNFLNSLIFTDAYNGWAVGSCGTVVKTNDGGETWKLQQSYTTNNLNSVFFINKETGWIVGDNNSTILKTVDGGNNWEILIGTVKTNLKSVYFSNENVGWIVGDSGTILNTNDGGITWNQYIDLPASLKNIRLNNIKFTSDLNGWIAGDNKTLLHTTDGGLTWVAVNNLPGTYWYDNLLVYLLLMIKYFGFYPVQL
jgi:photosystem II stability/assembly factor-like uncharacterized protein